MKQSETKKYLYGWTRFLSYNVISRFTLKNFKNCSDRDGSDGVRQHAAGRKEAVEKVIEILELPIT